MTNPSPKLRSQDSRGYRYARKVIRLGQIRFVEADPVEIREWAISRLEEEMHVKGLRVKSIDVTFLDRDPDTNDVTDDDYVWALVEAIIV